MTYQNKLTKEIMAAIKKCIASKYIKRETLLGFIFEASHVNLTESSLALKALRVLIPLPIEAILDYKHTLTEQEYFRLLWREIYVPLYKRINRIGVKKDIEGMRQGQFPYIPLGVIGFVSILNYIRTHHGKRKHFIDVGCGIGDKVMFASFAGICEKTTGIEYDKHTYDIANDNINHLIEFKTNQYGDNNIQHFIHGDAFKHSFKHYDTIYLYCPLKNADRMSELLYHIYNTAEKGTIIIFKNACLDMRLWELKYGFKDTWVDSIYCNVITKE